MVDYDDTDGDGRRPPSGQELQILEACECFCKHAILSMKAEGT